MTSGRRAPLLLLATALFAALLTLAFTINVPSLTEVDRSVWNWFDVHQSPGWHVDSDGAFSYLGKPFHVAAAGVVGGALLSLAARSVTPLLLVAGSVAAGVVVEHILKAVITRTAEIAPMASLDYQHSFPSGHVTGSLTLLGTMAVCLGAPRSGAWRAALAGLALAGVVTVALLALYSYAHTFTDVIGGSLLGGAIVALAAVVLALARTGGRAARVPVVADATV